MAGHPSNPRAQGLCFGYWASVGAILAPFAVSAALCFGLGVAEARVYYSEGGPFELGTALLMVTVASLCLAWRQHLNIRSLLPPFIALLMAAREFDAQNWIEHLGAPLIEDLIAGAVILPIAAIILYFLWRVRFSILKTVRDFQPYALSTMLGFAMVVLSLSLDGISRKFFNLTGVKLSSQAGDLAHIAEETGEFAMALAFLVALLQLRYDPERNTLPVTASAAP